MGVRAACKALRVAHSTYYRRRRPKKTGQRQPRPTPARALSEAERTEVFEVLCSSRFADRAPAEVYATLLDEGVYLCSERTMYRILAENQAVRERRAQRSHPNHPKPEVVARAPNEVWSWDVTRLLGPRKGQYFYLYVILDIFSRYVTGWMVAERETAGLAGRLIEESCLKHGVRPQVLTLHSDRGSPMTAKCTAQLLADLGVTQSLSRPRVSNDNPYSEAQFKTNSTAFTWRCPECPSSSDRSRPGLAPDALDAVAAAEAARTGCRVQVAKDRRPVEALRVLRRLARPRSSAAGRPCSSFTTRSSPLPDEVKYHPGFPGRFSNIEEAKEFCRSFFPWYNTEHRHGGIGLLTPAQVHFGDAPEVIRQRQDVLAAAYAARPERFVAGPPRASELPAQVWINPPLPVSAVDGEDRTADGEGDDGKEGPLH